MLPPPPRSTLFPYTTLFRSLDVVEVLSAMLGTHQVDRVAGRSVSSDELIRQRPDLPIDRLGNGHRRVGRDRKSTRLNSSHTVISYAVFCLKKKITTDTARHA